MTIGPELEAQILRYYHVEKWRVGTIARQLRVHGDTVRRVLAQAGLPQTLAVQRPSRIDAYLPFIRQTLEKFPSLTASRLYRMVRERGYRGGPDHFRHLISLHRPRSPHEAYLRLATLPGEQSQIDWGHFGHLAIGRARRPLMAFVMVLSWSRRIFLRFFNLKSAVLERRGDAIRFHPTLLALAGHYRFEPRPVAVGRGNEKGRVERAIRYVRESFFAARAFTDLDDLNAQAEHWCLGQASDRPCPQDGTISVREAFAREQPRLLALPENPYPTGEQVEVNAHKTPYVRFDLNDYSIPHTHVQRTLTVRADPTRVRVLDGSKILADHPRSYDRHAQIEDPAHVETLIQYKRQARQHRGADHLTRAAPASRDLLIGAAERGGSLGAITAALLRLLDRYGAAELQAAILAALAEGVPHPNAVRRVLERRREARHDSPPTAVCLPEHVKQKDTPVQPHRLDTYDNLTGKHDEPS